MRERHSTWRLPLAAHSASSGQGHVSLGGHEQITEHDLLMSRHAREEPNSVRTLRHLDVEPGASCQLFKLTGSIRVIHPFGVFVDRIVC